MLKFAVYVLSLKDYLQAHSQISFITSSKEAIARVCISVGLAVNWQKNLEGCCQIFMKCSGNVNDGPGKI